MADTGLGRESAHPLEFNMILCEQLLGFKVLNSNRWADYQCNPVSAVMKYLLNMSKV